MERKSRFKNIPNIAHFYWGNSPLPFLNYLSLLTFRATNPYWKVILHAPEESNPGRDSKEPLPWLTNEQSLPYTGKDWRREAFLLADRRNLDLPGPPMKHDVHRADMLRHLLMYKEGGLWSDMDILWIRSVEALPCPDNVDLCLSYKENPGFYSTGFVMTSPNGGIYKRIHEESFHRYKAQEYQAIGPELVRKIWPEIKQLKKEAEGFGLVFCPIPMSCFYPYSWDNMERLWIAGDLSPIKESIGIHWFGGNVHSMKARNEATPANLGPIQDILSFVEQGSTTTPPEPMDALPQ